MRHLSHQSLSAVGFDKSNTIFASIFLNVRNRLLLQPLLRAQFNRASCKCHITLASIHETKAGSLFKVGHNRRTQALHTGQKHIHRHYCVLAERALKVCESKVTLTSRATFKRCNSRKRLTTAQTYKGQTSSLLSLHHHHN